MIKSILKVLWLLVKNFGDLSQAERELDDKIREETVKNKLLKKRLKEDGEI